MFLEVHTFTAGPLDTNAHLVWDPQTSACWIVDAPHGSARSIQNWIQQKKARPEALILTHSHWDHFGDAAELHEKLAIPVWAHAADVQNLEHPGSDRVPSFLPQRAVQVQRTLQEGDELMLGSSRWKVIHTPGHTPGGICLWQPDQKLLLVGDTLFHQSYGRTDLSTGDPKKMRSSLKRLLDLPTETLFFPGHGPSATIGEQEWPFSD